MKFFRYQSINKLTLQNLSNQKNWVADPLEFNDPFEFSLVNKYYYDNEEEKKQIDGIKKIQEQISEFGVICYSSVCTNNLLWAHYADNHKGMCLVFDVPEENIKSLYKVSYQKEFPIIKIKDLSKAYEEIIPVVTTKSFDWAYEEEYRQIFIIKNILEEYPGQLVEIIFGCRTPFNDIQIVRDIAVSKNNEIQISKMIMEENQYQLAKGSTGDNKNIPKFWALNDFKI